MKLKEFKKSSVWKAADCVEYVDKNGVEIEPTTAVQRRRMNNMEVISHGTMINGSIATLEVVLGKIKRMTTEEKWEEIYNVLDNMNIKYDTNYCDSETEALIEFWTDTAGQDIPTEFEYDGTPEDFVKQFTERAENYNVDEEVELYAGMRGQRGVPNTIKELFDDMQEAKYTLIKIADKLQKAINTEDTKQTIINNVINMIWDIAKISPEYGNALMDVLGDDVYNKIGKQANKEEVIK